MKIGSKILLGICAASLCFLVGMFVGKNLRDNYVQLPVNSPEDAITVTETMKDYRLDINSATKTQLMELPGIGEMLAERIIAYRTENGPYATTDELLNVEGIGEKKLSVIEERIKVGG